MAQLYTEPLMDVINLSQWEILIQKTTFEAGGFMMLSINNIGTTSAPQIGPGSRLEVGGSLYKCMESETPTGTPTEGVCYVYCVPAGAQASFTYSTTGPWWIAAKGGWYNGDNRAVIKFYYTGGNYNGKVLLDSYVAMKAVNHAQPIPTTGGVQVVNIANTKTRATYDLDPGGYRYSLLSGKGEGDAAGKNGGVPVARKTVSGVFLWEGGSIQILTGGDGFSGGAGGGTGTGVAQEGYGGGGGAGEESEIVGIIKTERVRAGISGSARAEGTPGNAGSTGGAAAGISYGVDGYGGGGDGGNGGSPAAEITVGGGGGGGSGAGPGGSGGTGAGSGSAGNGGKGGSSTYASSGTNGANGSGSGINAGGGGGGGGGAPGWRRPQNGAGGSCQIWRVL
jgi:hypothetical protein